MTKLLKYTILITPQEPRGYLVTVPELPGCFTEGDTIEESFKMASDAIDSYLSVLEQENLPIPEERKTIISTIELNRKIPA
ncbi:MAG: hypothetical protein CEN88_436 [Candidatus Berkelbacteria bacterium Licking1014_2]|uniref:HicB-like antitoxin of toxin-antitoxin system domain-containing protein n=1 Tax=Candidatus Berkelbacteria bacterium Licking1014_2 TaxID=2017146 RepID=A0A554LSD7_9BACT|nr:MAG: hypothetical protein CEN88_436 [Candidatus Berkelbacteria bacterium Licking1014_2]